MKSIKKSKQKKNTEYNKRAMDDLITRLFTSLFEVFIKEIPVLKHFIMVVAIIICVYGTLAIIINIYNKYFKKGGEIREMFASIKRKISLIYFKNVIIKRGDYIIIERVDDS